MQKFLKSEMKGLLIQLKMFFIFIADLAAAFTALSLMLLIRYGVNNFQSGLSVHLLPFTLIILLFTIIFYSFNLYSFRFNKNITELTTALTKGLIVAFIMAIIIFYIFGDFFKLTPKTNLIIFTGIFGILDFYLRITIKRFFARNRIHRKVILIAEAEDDLIQELMQNQNSSYRIILNTKDFDLSLILKEKPDAVVIDTIEGRDFSKIYTIMTSGITVHTVSGFYEEVFQKVPTEKIEKDAIIEYLNKNKMIFNFEKRILDIILSLILIVASLPISIIVTLLIKTTSRGPVFFKHTRITKDDRKFTIYKFRSMYTDAEKNGAVWTENNKNDPRITPIGRFLRETHLDEIPQLINILRGDISFVGPRPERPEFTSMLQENIPYYDLRHSVKAGLTGWAQVNYKYGSSVDDAREKLKYDFYYIKNRNIFFDILIILKTAAKIFTH